MTARYAAELAALAEGDDVKACCAALYENPVVRWLLGGELHPGGADTTRRALELIGADSGDLLLDVAAGTGSSALLAARELGCRAVGVEYGVSAVAAALAAAAAERLDDRVEFIVGDAEELPFADGEFDLVLCECSLCTFPNKARALGEMRRVVRPGGRVAIADVVADHDRLPEELRGAMATIACVGEALTVDGYRELIEGAGLGLLRIEPRDADADALAERVRDRLRGARIVVGEELADLPGGIDGAIGLVDRGRRAIAEGALGYSIFVAAA